MKGTAGLLLATALAALSCTPVYVFADGPTAASTPAAEPRSDEPRIPIRIGAYWWDGWFEGSPYIRAPLITEYKDREPEWGWRDDSQSAVDDSIRAAARYGLDFFAFLWYPEHAWSFTGGQPSGVMNNGLRFYLASATPERRRVGFLLMIVHSPGGEDWELTCRTWSRDCLAREQYVRIQGRPVLFFYDLADLETKLGGREKVRPAMTTLRTIAKENGCSEPFLVLRAQKRDEAAMMEECGFDGATDYAVAHSPPGEHPYADLEAVGVKRWNTYAGQRSNYIPSVTAGWDGRPRAWMKKSYYEHWYRRSPAEFGRFVGKGIDWIRTHPRDVPAEPLLMIYAWNELDEGGAICPTRGEGPAYLEALRAARRQAR